MKAKDALALAKNHRIPLDCDFDALSSDTVRRIIQAADFVKYRTPKNANGSRGRYFYALLNRSVTRK